jgi:hypothetical protein
VFHCFVGMFFWFWLKEFLDILYSSYLLNNVLWRFLSLWFIFFLSVSFEEQKILIFTKFNSVFYFQLLFFAIFLKFFQHQAGELSLSCPRKWIILALF